MFFSSFRRFSLSISVLLLTVSSGSAFDTKFSIICCAPLGVSGISLESNSNIDDGADVGTAIPSLETVKTGKLGVVDDDATLKFDPKTFSNVSSVIDDDVGQTTVDEIKFDFDDNNVNSASDDVNARRRTQLVSPSRKSWIKQTNEWRTQRFLDNKAKSTNFLTSVSEKTSIRCKYGREQRATADNTWRKKTDQISARKVSKS